MHADLIARLEKLDGPDRRIDAEIDALFRVGKPRFERWAWNNFPTWRAAKQTGMCEVVHSNGTGGLVWDSDPFTASLDAAVALCERLLPGCVWQVKKYGGKWRPGYRFGARVSMPYSGRGDDENGEPHGHGHDIASSAAIALVIALLKAKSS